ncbi:MAG: DUF4143 domain-containing protein [Actinomycetales bacterium]|nr:DUF4143 domain-containing protein [Actinomycetales bacterium]
MVYLPRVADAALTERLTSAGAVLIEGPKACGKTETARQQARSEIRLDVDTASRLAVDVAPGTVLAQPAPLLIDEWQLAPTVWDHVRRAVDDRKQHGQFILTGSAQPTDDARRHSGAGRISAMRMRPMSLSESRNSSAEVSLGKLLDGHAQPAPDPGMTVEVLADLVAQGGWPALLGLDARTCSRRLNDYLDQTCHVDVLLLSGSRRDPEKVRLLLRSLARHTATQAAVTTVTADVSQFGDSIDRKTASDYISALERLMIVENQPAWSPALRSRSHVRVSPKRHFVDPSLAVAAMGASPQRLLRDPETLGLLFESLVVRDLRVLASALDASGYHDRDNNNLEIDAIVQCLDGRWGAFEIKLGAGAIDAAAAQLLAFRTIVDTAVCGEPAVLAVITSTGPAYLRKDGVHVVPIGTLGL